MTEGPLAGVTILDLTRLLPGGYCTLVLADLGADVVKIEEPGRGDYIRWTPPLLDGESAAHRALNRGKRSITLNLKDQRGKELLRRLTVSSDVLLESFRPGVMDRLGLGYASLSDGNPGLIMCSITGYGQDGPHRDLVGHDINYIGYGGLLSLMGPPGGPPEVPAGQIGDLGGGGLPAAVGILAALVERQRTGRGRFVDVSMLDGVVSWLSVPLAAHLVTGVVPEPGTLPLSGGYACYRVYRAGDGRYLTIGALEPQFWRALCERLGCEDLVDRQFDPPEGQEEMARRLQELFAARTRDEWVEEFDGVAACVGPVLDLAEAIRDPQVSHRGMLAEVDGRPVGPGPSIKMAGAAPQRLGPAPGFGEHTAEILGAIGVSPQELSALRADGVV